MGVRLILPLIILVLAIFTQKVHAYQRKEENYSTKIGIGFKFNSKKPQILAIPIQIERHFRLEIGFGLDKNYQKVSTNSSQRKTLISTQASFLYYNNEVSEDYNFGFYFGPKIGAFFDTETNRDLDGEKAEKIDLMVGLISGGEYFLSPSFSIGGEVSLAYTGRQDTKISKEHDCTKKGDRPFSRLETSGMGVIRWYFP